MVGLATVGVVGAKWLALAKRIQASGGRLAIPGAAAPNQPRRPKAPSLQCLKWTAPNCPNNHFEVFPLRGLLDEKPGGARDFFRGLDRLFPFHAFPTPVSDSFIRVLQLLLFMEPADEGASNTASLSRAPGAAPPQVTYLWPRRWDGPIEVVEYCHVACHCGRRQEMGRVEQQAEQWRRRCLPRDRHNHISKDTDACLSEDEAENEEGGAVNKLRGSTHDCDRRNPFVRDLVCETKTFVDA